jgi:hypothetical protein
MVVARIDFFRLLGLPQRANAQKLNAAHGDEGCSHGAACRCSGGSGASRSL